MRLELTNTGFAIQRLSHLATRANFGTEGEIRTLESSLEDSHVSSYITSANILVGEDRVELSPRVPRTRMLTLHHTPNGGTERTRTVISLIDNQVPHPSATVPCEKILGWVEGT